MYHGRLRMTLSPLKDHLTACALWRPRFRFTIAPALLLALLTGCHTAPEPQITVAAAADLQFAMEDVLRGFRQAHPSADLKVVYGSSGNFYSQIRNHAPFDLLLSADIQYPRRLAGEGLALQDTLFTYATGRIVVWALASSPLDVARLGWAALDVPSVRHIAIANPDHAPYGRAAAAAMKSAGILDRVSSRLVMGENIAQTLQFVQSGAAEIGVVALSLAMAPSVREQGKYWEIPADSYPPIEQGGILLTRARDSRVARDLREYLISAAGRDILKRYGFYPPGS
jgi:molybdate transport system substrate-binding protein